MERFTNKSPGALTMEQAIARHKKSIAEGRRRLRQAQELAAQGRGEDTEVAHLTPGELVIPRALQSPELIDALQRAAAAHNIPLEMLSVGNAANRVNPNTGAPEFGILNDMGRGIDHARHRIREAVVPVYEDAVVGLSQWANVMPGNNTAVVLPNNTINSPDAQTSEADLNFDPKGPALSTEVLRHPMDAFRAGLAAEQARIEAKDHYQAGNPALQNGEGDAWRHSRWNQIMAQSIGPERAKGFADAYERWNWNENEGTRLMDLYNNHIGRSIAQGGAPHLDIHNAITSGYLRTSPFNPRKW